ncbi:MAG: acyltransferase, partial [Clostridiales bacterium]|nr:acyltransferase [Clostridiales bacterium]
SYNAQLFLGEMEAAAQVYRAEHLLGDLLGQIAVPGFFMISGYLFYRNFGAEEAWRVTLAGKWRRRIRSLLVPYILWNFIYYVGYVIASRLPWVCDVVGKGTIPFTIESAVDAVLHYTYNYVFWYLYQLILLTMLAPVLYLSLRRRWSRYLFLGAVWAMVLANVDVPLVNEDALVYYATAASAALAGVPVPERSQTPAGLAAGAGMILAAAASWYLGLRFAWVAGFVLCRVLAVSGLWLATPGEKLPEAGDFMKHSFFLYTVHFAFVRLINKIGAMAISAVKWEPFALYLLMPVLVLGISTALAKLLRRWCPPCWNLLNGGRN